VNITIIQSQWRKCNKSCAKTPKYFARCSNKPYPLLSKMRTPSLPIYTLCVICWVGYMLSMHYICFWQQFDGKFYFSQKYCQSFHTICTVSHFLNKAKMFNDFFSQLKIAIRPIFYFYAKVVLMKCKYATSFCK